MSPAAAEKSGAAARTRASGAWLVTYADLMTNLVCFFVLIVSYSVLDQTKIAVVAGSMREAFGVTRDRRFAGDVEFRGTPEARQPGNITPSERPSGQGVAETLSAPPGAGADGSRGGFDAAAAQRRQFEAAKERLEQAILLNPLTRGGAEAITINLVDNGLQIVIVDREGRPMFEPGAAAPSPEARALLAETARTLIPFANRLIIEGHADATGAGAYSPFDLTAARANAARRIMEEAGVPADRIAGVVGRGDAIPLYPEDPYAPGNRRIEIVLEKTAPLLPDEMPF